MALSLRKLFVFTCSFVLTQKPFFLTRELLHHKTSNINSSRKLSHSSSGIQHRVDEPQMKDASCLDRRTDPNNVSKTLIGPSQFEQRQNS